MVEDMETGFLVRIARAVVRFAQEVSRWFGSRNVSLSARAGVDIVADHFEEARFVESSYTLTMTGLLVSAGVFFVSIVALIQTSAGRVSGPFSIVPLSQWLVNN